MEPQLFLGRNGRSRVIDQDLGATLQSYRPQDKIYPPTTTTATYTEEFSMKASLRQVITTKKTLQMAL